VALVIIKSGANIVLSAWLVMFIAQTLEARAIERRSRVLTFMEGFQKEVLMNSDFGFQHYATSPSTRS
jgi:hypothetical protein